MNVNIPYIIFLQSDEDEDNFDEVRFNIEQSIIKERLSRIAAFGSPDSPPLGEDVAGEQASAKEKISCEAIHKKFNLNSCYLCKNGNAKDKRDERKKSKFCSVHVSQLLERFSLECRM